MLLKRNNCIDCKANNGCLCLLGYERELKKQEIYKFYYKPLEKCPKPKNDRKYIKLLEPYIEHINVTIA